MPSGVEVIDLSDNSPNKLKVNTQSLPNNNIHENDLTENGGILNNTASSNIDDETTAPPALDHPQQSLMQACILLQLSVLQEQTKCLEELQQQMTSKTKLPSLPSLIVFPSPSTKQRSIDHFEEVLLDLLDREGRITLRCKVASLILLMNMTIKMEHRGICLHVITKSLSREAKEWFVLDGGLKVLRRWVNQGLQADRIILLSRIVEVCLALPFDIDSAKSSEIGKSMKRILKHKSAVNDTSNVCALVKRLMTEWKDHVANNIRISRPQIAVNPSLPLPRFVYEVDSHITAHHLREKEIERDIVEAFKDEDSTAEPQAMQIDNDEALIPNIEDEPMDIDDGLAVTEPDDTPIEITPTRETTPDEPIEMSAEDVPVTMPEVVSPAVVIPTVCTTVNFAPSPRNQSQPIPLSVLLQQRAAQQSPTPVSPPAAVSSPIAFSSAPPSSAPKKIPIPVLKRKRDDAVSTVKSVRWVDETGGRLCETRTIEVEGIRRSIAHYRSHKDLVRREKQQEKSAHIAMIQDSMQATTSWNRPQLLIIPNEVQDNRARNTLTPEVTTQQERIRNEPETINRGDAMTPVPRNPKDVNDSILFQSAVSTPPALVPWALPGEVDEAESKDDETAMLVASLPDCLKFLDEKILFRLVQDESLAMSLLCEDGSVNEDRVKELQQEEMRKTTPLPAKPAFGKRHRGPGNGANARATSITSSPATTFYGPQSLSRKELDRRHERREQNHARVERRVVAVVKNSEEKWNKRMTPCKNFSATGSCRFGDGCYFGHFVARK